MSDDLRAPETSTSRSLVGLTRRLADITVRLIRSEIRLAVTEVADRAKAAGIGIGLLVAGAVLLFFVFCVLLATAVLGLSAAVAPWLAALIIGGVLLVVAVVLALIGLAKVRRGVPPVPDRTAESVKDDVRAVRPRHA